MNRQKMMHKKVKKFTVLAIFALVLKFDMQFCSKKVYMHGHFCTFLTITWSFLHLGTIFKNRDHLSFPFEISYVYHMSSFMGTVLQLYRKTISSTTFL